MSSNRAWVPPQIARRRPSLSGVIAAVTCVSFLAPLAPSQQQFGQLSTHAIPDAEGTLGKCRVGDVDGDGDLDLLLTAVSTQDRLYLNEGDGMFVDVTARNMPADNGWTTHAEFADVDRDGDLDLALSRSSGFTSIGTQNRLLLNNGTGSFTDATTLLLPLDVDKTSKIVAADVDGDGAIDLLVANTTWSGGGRQNRQYRNDGTGRFNDATAGNMPGLFDDTWDLAAGDVDGDGDIDFVTASLYGSEALRLFLNDGSGRYTLVTAGLVVAGRNGYSVELLDIDNDGDLDVIGNVESRLVVFVNDGRGNFTDESAARAPSGRMIVHASGDLDLDGDVDLVVSNFDGTSLRNDGTGHFTIGQPIATVFGTIAADVDGDVDLDLVSPYTRDVLLNDGTGAFYDRLADERRAPSLPGDPAKAVAGDVDGDGDTDLAIAVQTNGGSNADRLWLNDGRDFFTDAPAALPPSPDGSSSVAMADIDLDGDQDLILGSYQGQRRTRVLLNDGRGGYTDGTTGRIPQVLTQTLALLALDVDRDGDPDLVQGTFAASSRLLLNDGTGTFTDSPVGTFPTNTDSSRALAAADVDRDGDPDLLIANSLHPTSLYLNDGRGRFTDVTMARMPAVTFDVWSLAVADFDRDGDVDVALADASGSPRLFLNDGLGGFTAAPAGRIPTGLDALFLHAVDVESDGDIDLVGGSARSVRVLTNDGTGTFSLQQGITDLGSPFAVTDADVDGDPDVVFAMANIGSGVVTNLRRHLSLSRLLRISRTTTITVHAVGRPAGVAVAIPVFAPLPGRAPLPPFGVLGIAPSTGVAGPAIVLPAGVEVESVDLFVPANLALIGQPIYVQAVIAEGVDVRLTNTIAARFVH